MASSTYGSCRKHSKRGVGSPAAALPALAAALALAAAIAPPADAQAAQAVAQATSAGATSQEAAALPATAYEVHLYTYDPSKRWTSRGMIPGPRVVATPDFTVTLDGDPGVVRSYEWSFSDAGEGAGCSLEVRSERYGIRYTVDCVPEGADPEEGAPYEACAVRTAGPAMRDEGRAVRLCVEAPGRGEGDLAWASDVADAVLPHVSVDPADVPSGMTVAHEGGATVARTAYYEVRLPDADFPQGAKLVYEDGYTGFGEGVKFADHLMVYENGSGEHIFDVILADKDSVSHYSTAVVGDATFLDLDMMVTVQVGHYMEFVSDRYSAPYPSEAVDEAAAEADRRAAQYAHYVTAVTQPEVAAAGAAAGAAAEATDSSQDGTTEPAAQ